MALWHRLGSIVTLRQGQGTADDDFSLVRISPDGRTITYKRYGYDAPVPADLKSAKPHALTLPF